MKKILQFILASLVSTSLYAVDRPNTLEVKKVIDYYKYGKDQGVILVESILCREIYRSGPQRNNAKNIVKTVSVKKGEKIYLWMNFLVPEHLNANIHFEYKNKGKVRQASDLGISTAPRYRSWKKVPTNKKGTWEISISQELEESDIELATITYTVQ